MEIERNVFTNKKNGQCSIFLPKKFLLKSLKLEEIPETVKLKISVPKVKVVKAKYK